MDGRIKLCNFQLYPIFTELWKFLYIHVIINYQNHPKGFE